MAQKKRFKMTSAVWQLVGLAALALITLGVVAYALIPAKTAAPFAAPIAQPTTTKTAEPKPTIAFLGDSYSAGGGASANMAWTNQLANAKGWTYDVFAHGGTGYVTDSPLGPNYLVAAEKSLGMKPTTVIVSGGRNDVNADPAAVQEAAKKLFTMLADGGAKVFVTSPVWDSREAPASLSATAAAIEAAAVATGATYLDIGEPLAGKPDVITADNVHPNDAGHKLLADAVGASLSSHKLL